MSAKTADTEEETLESPTPPKAAPISPDQREDEILEEDEEETEVIIQENVPSNAGSKCST